MGKFFRKPFLARLLYLPHALRICVTHENIIVHLWTRGKGVICGRDCFEPMPNQVKVISFNTSPINVGMLPYSIVDCTDLIHLNVCTHIKRFYSIHVRVRNCGYVMATMNVSCVACACACSHACVMAPPSPQLNEPPNSIHYSYNHSE